MGHMHSILQRWKRNSAITRATDQRQPAALADYLQQHPEDAERIATTALSLCDRMEFWHALLLCIGLAMVRSPHAVRLLERLLADSEDEVLRRGKPVPWNGLDPQQLHCLVEFLEAHGADSVRDRLLLHLSDDQLVGVMPEIGHPRFVDCLRSCLANGDAAETVTDCIVSSLEKLAFSMADRKQPTDADRRSLQHACDAAVLLWNAGRRDLSLEVLSDTVVLRADPVGDDMLRNIAGDFTSYKPLDMVRAAGVLRRFPSAAWIPSLKKAWVAITMFVRHHRGQSESPEQKHSIAPAIAAAANAIAVTLGVCASCDKRYRSLESQTQRPRELEKRQEHYRELIKEHNRLVAEYKATAQMSAGREQQIAERIIQIQEKMAQSESQVEAAHQSWLGEMSPGYVLLSVLNDDQTYNPAVRQGAAWGLHKLCELGNLDQPSHEKIARALQNALQGHDSSELQERLEEMLPDDPSLHEAVNAAATEYLYTRNLVKLRENLGRLPLADDLQKQVALMTRSFAHDEFSHDFQERAVQFLPGQRVLELEQTLLDGLVWMADLEDDTGDDRDENALDYGQVRRTIRLLHSLMPNALVFLSHYPLRLMTLNQHARLLGQFSRTRCGVSLWFWYSPPLWRRGAKPNEVGVVHQRYVSLDDRSLPNSLGICHHLFRHPVLALPVIYHEYLHYGGPEGNPDDGIENEAEVLLREIIFARGLIARLAPAEDEAIPEFEREIVAAIQETGLNGLGYQLNCELEDDKVWNAICGEIEESYGTPLTPEQAEQEITGNIERENRGIRLTNLTSEMKRHWFPDIEWPSLDTAETKSVSTGFRRILQKSLTCDHHFSPARRDLVLASPSCQQDIALWNTYKQRRHALQEFRLAWPMADSDWREVLASIVNRVHLERPSSSDRSLDADTLFDFLSHLLASNKEGKGE
jgi:hypothetical protein